MRSEGHTDDFFSGEGAPAVGLPSHTAIAESKLRYQGRSEKLLQAVVWLLLLTVGSS